MTILMRIWWRGTFVKRLGIYEKYVRPFEISDLPWVMYLFIGGALMWMNKYEFLAVLAFVGTFPLWVPEPKEAVRDL